ncbi:CRISPR-associated protein Cas4 [Paludisphaera mucosa]|uniref:CRISPR-associated exonuclease Cas4 n=1 Tax=Paludisphaera mucosa TaxID=3030827 RepID=A0ABT6FB36_9BACT|nr:CRISPR-associated protein Cas4 [Paludisphaera mucosa]MDG3004769.1 CRISPR-associated protein Cas4 [Paludisphaera mucosa]
MKSWLDLDASWEPGWARRSMRDLFECEEFRREFPVEYKRGRPKSRGADEVQLCAQAMCLEEMLGLDVPRGSLFYGETRRRKPVEFTPTLRSRVEEAARRCRELFDSRTTPRVARHKGCDRCSLLESCLPEVTGRPTASQPGATAQTHYVELPEDAP